MDNGQRWPPRYTPPPRRPVVPIWDELAGPEALLPPHWSASAFEGAQAWPLVSLTAAPCEHNHRKALVRIPMAGSGRVVPPTYGLTCGFFT